MHVQPGQSLRPRPPLQGDGNRTDALELEGGIYAAFAAGGVPRVLGFLHPEVRWHEAENPPLADRNPYIGVDVMVAGLFGRLDRFWQASPLRRRRG